MQNLFPYILPQASSFAPGIDFVLWLINIVCLIFTVGVAFFIFIFAARYRQGNKVNRKLPHHEGIALEMTWTIIPLIIAMGIFVLSTVVYFQVVRPPANATEIFVVGKQWMWKIQHPNGRWEMNELHIPVGKPVKLTMISEDVIHDFGLPAFRLNMDVIPGRYTHTWFTPTRKGRYHIFCAQYCGTNHSIMGGYVTVMDNNEWEQWMQTGSVSTSLASQGERLFRDYGCTGCHGPNANVRAPSLNGIYGKALPIQITDNKPLGPNEPAVATSTVIADYRYLHDSITLPYKEVAAGYKPIMPSFQGRLSEEEIIQLIDYIKSLKTSNGTSNGSAAGYVTPPGEVGGGNALGLSELGDARSGRANNGGNATGDMTNPYDRDAYLREPLAVGNGTGDATSGRVNQAGNATGDMTNPRDRDNIFRGGGAAANNATLDRAAGGMRNQNNNERGGLNVRNTDNYTNDSARVYTGGLKPAGPKTGATPKAR